MAGWHPGRRWHASKPGADLTPARLPPPVFLEVLEAMEEKRSALLEAMKRRSLELVRERCTCDLNLIHNGVGEECLLTPRISCYLAAEHTLSTLPRRLLA